MLARLSALDETQIVSATRAFKAKLERGEFTGNATTCSPMPQLVYHLVIKQKQFEEGFCKNRKGALGKGEGWGRALILLLFSFFYVPLCVPYCIGPTDTYRSTSA